MIKKNNSLEQFLKDNIKTFRKSLSPLFVKKNKLNPFSSDRIIRLKAYELKSENVNIEELYISNYDDLYKTIELITDEIISDYDRNIDDIDRIIKKEIDDITIIGGRKAQLMAREYKRVVDSSSDEEEKNYAINFLGTRKKVLNHIKSRKTDFQEYKNHIEGLYNSFLVTYNLIEYFDKNVQEKTNDSLDILTDVVVDSIIYGLTFGPGRKKIDNYLKGQKEESIPVRKSSLSLEKKIENIEQLEIIRSNFELIGYNSKTIEKLINRISLDQLEQRSNYVTSQMKKYLGDDKRKYKSFEVNQYLFTNEDPVKYQKKLDEFDNNLKKFKL